MQKNIKTILNFLNGKNYLDLRKRKNYWSLIIILALIFTIFNNYYFYTYVEYAVKKDVEQLKLILEGDLKYFRLNTISAKKYREHTRIIVKQFSKKAQYNKQISLHYQNATLKRTGEFKKGYEPWEFKSKNEKVVQSIIKIIIPNLKSNADLIYMVDVKEVGFLNKTFLLSVFKSMTLSLTDVIFFPKPKEKLSIYENWKRYYLPRSRNPLIFLLVLWVLTYRIRKYQRELYKEIDRLEGMLPQTYSEDIQNIMNCLKTKDIKTLKLLLDEGIEIDSKDSDGMTALMLYMLTDTTAKDKQEVIKILLDNGSNINARNNVGMTALMICAQKEKEQAVKILLDNKADTTIKQELTAKDIGTQSIKRIISETQNTYPQELVKILSKFTHNPMKFTTHTWDFGSLKSVVGTFEEAMEEIRLEFKTMETELQKLSPNLYKKIYTFLFNEDPNLEYSWCSRVQTNVGWLNLDGLKEYCDEGKNAFDFQLKETIIVDNKEISTFGEVVGLFKQEIEIRTDFKNLETIFSFQKKKLGREFKFNLTDAKLHRQFYTDTQKLNFAIGKFFEEIKKRKDYKTINLTTKEFNDHSLEIRITQVGSKTKKSSKNLFDEVLDGDFADIKRELNNLCDWSVESVCEDGSFRINYLHSNNVIDIEPIEIVNGFTHILRFYR